MIKTDAHRKVFAAWPDVNTGRKVRRVAVENRSTCLHLPRRLTGGNFSYDFFSAGWE
ncbi:MAG: hypothetical protein WCG03_08840 [Kiritimatiellales bacterium]